ncbi:MAG: helix-turn-helix domain-containing protein [archaeon]
MIESVLEEIGLTKNEIRVYLSLLELGETKTGEILRHSGINSGKIYEILDSLKKKGLVSEIKKAGVLCFSPANPKRVISYLEEKKSIITNQETNYQKILPQLLEKVNLKKSKLAIEIFTGLKGMKTAFAKELEFGKNETLYVFGIASPQYYDKTIWNFFTTSHQQKREKRRYKVLKLHSEESKKDKVPAEKNAKVRYIPYISPVSINIIGNLTIIGIFSAELVFITIENEEVAKSFIKQFEFFWKIAKE